MPLEYALQFRGINPDPAPWKITPSVAVRANSILGIKDLPNQLAKRSKSRTFIFNLMVVGMGKYNLIDKANLV